MASHGLVLDSKGKLQPHEVRVPFAVPRAYQAFPETKPHPSAQDAREQGIAQSVLQSVAAYREACEADAGFQQQRSALTKLEEQLKSDTTNEVLSRQYQEQEAAFQQHPLYQQGCDLAKEAQKLREAERTKADHIILSKAEMQLGVGGAKLKQREQHRQVATGIRDDLLQPVREILKRPSTPPRERRTGQFAKGVGESAVETAKLPVNLLVLSAKLLGGAAHSLATWEDKLGIGEKITDASELISAFGQELKYEWENPEEYQERLKAARACRAELDRAERALNAEAYHNKADRELGYWSGAALQTVFGEEIIKQVAKGVSTTAKAAKVAGKVAEVSKVEARASALGAAGKRTKQLLKAKGTFLNKPENVSKLEKFIINANELTEGKGTLSGLGTTPASAINSAIYHSTTAEQGAAIFRSIAQEHVFRDGNKRTAVTFWQEFMRVHGIQCTLKEKQLLDVAQKVAEGKLLDTSHIAEALLK